MYDDDYNYYGHEAAVDKKKKKKEEANQRKLIRYKEITDEEIKKEGSELLAKIVKSIPEHFDKAGALANRYGVGRKAGVIFAKKDKDSKNTQQVIRIALSLQPAVVIDYVVSAFKTKGWGAKHTFSDYEGFDFIDLTLPEDWLKRVLCIGRYTQKISEEPKPAE